MSEISLPWDGDVGGSPAAPGDAGPYSAADWDDLYKYLNGDGIMPGVGDELIVAGTSSPVSVGAGVAVVNGKFYRNTASLNVAVPSPTGATRVDRIVLQADYTAQTVRVARLAGAEGGAAPALTQSDGVKWEISLAQVSITTAGVITVTSEREAIDQGRLPGEMAVIYVSEVTASKQPVRNGLIYPNWYLCDGSTYNGRATPNMADRVPIGVGTIAAAQGATGGGATKDLTHTHGAGTLDTDTEASHAHQVNLTSSAPSMNVTATTGGATNFPTGAHTHDVAGYTVGSGSHDHAVEGNTASGGSATQDIMPPYLAVRWFMFSPA
jgi:hypothetical protein